ACAAIRALEERGCTATEVAIHIENIRTARINRRWMSWINHHEVDLQISHGARCRLRWQPAVQHNPTCAAIHTLKQAPIRTGIQYVRVLWVNRQRTHSENTRIAGCGSEAGVCGLPVCSSIDALQYSADCSREYRL